MFNVESDLVEDVVSLRNQLRLTEKNLQTLGEQLSQSENDGVAVHKAGSRSDEFPGHLALEDLQKPDAVKTLSYPVSLERDTSGNWRTKAHSDCRCQSSGQEMGNESNEVSQLRRKLSSIREENSSLVLENRQLISDLEAAQLELASSNSKLRLLGSSIGTKTSVSVMKEHIQDLESQLETQAKAVRDAEHKLAASEQVVMQKVRAIEKLKEELKKVKLELSDETKQWKRMEQQRNQALRNAEKLSVAFKDYKAEVTEKLKKVMESEHKLKASLIECDREREELEKRCMEQERERERMAQNLRELREVGERSESLAAERLDLQGRLQEASQQLACLQREMTQKEAQLEEVDGLRREREDLRLLTACQEQRLVQAQREMESSRTEVASLEGILDMLHLRENREGALCVNPCLLPSPNYTASTDQLRQWPGERYQKLLAVLQCAEKEKERQASAAQGLQERLTRAQEEIFSLQASISQRASHYQQIHSQLLDKATKATRLEKEMKKSNSRLAVLEKQLQEKTAAYSQAAIKNGKLEQELLEKDSSLHHYQSVLNKKQREHLQAMEISKMAETKKCQDLEDQIEVLQSSLSQSQAEIKELRKSVSALKTEKQESQHQVCLLQASVDQLTQDIEASIKRSQEEIRCFEEQALESASKVTFLETELSCCKEELSCCLQKMEEVKQQYEAQLERSNSELSTLQEVVRNRVMACENSSEENLQLQCSIQRQHAMLQESTSRIGHLEESQSQLQSQVAQLEQELERERATSVLELRSRQKEVEEANQELKKRDRQAAELSGSVTQLSSEMNQCREELSSMEQELLLLRRDSTAKASQLSQMEETLQETKGLLDKKSEIVNDLEEKLHCSEMDRRNSLQRAQLLEDQLQVVRGELAGTLDHLQQLQDVLQRTQLTADQQQQSIDQLTAKLRESQRELEERTNEVLDMDTALKERQGELQQRAQLLGQLDVVIKEHKLEMEKKVEHLQDALEKTEQQLKDRVKQVEFLSEMLNHVKSQLEEREYLEKKTTQELQQAHGCYNALSRQLDDITQLKEAEVQVGVVEELHAESSAQLQATVTALQHELDLQREEHHKEISALQQTREQLLKVSGQISSSLRLSQEQLSQRLQQAQEELGQARAHASDLRSRLSSTKHLLQCANESLLIKDSEIARLQAKISSLERTADLQSANIQHESSMLPPLKDLPVYPSPQRDTLTRCSLSSTSWKDASSDATLEHSESVMASVEAALRPENSPDGGWQGLSTTGLTSTSDMSFNPLTYMVDAGETEEEDVDSLSGTLRFVHQTLALQEHHSLCRSSTCMQDSSDEYNFKEDST
ncbi:coiled-coil domain-containing protein 18 isoform X2 [Electrophorus electricus]|uniref:coiled-coil domain-containing protein 18 isoform X2 n=1 Tax=Electrophorus electricus TaxID=8005 RepID=UPI0015D0A520|nr:coiled-coil domain-containing protein 18 isoform X2 [Electrophorus electricus]